VLAADSTKVLLVGISHYLQPELCLRFAASNARDLEQALTSKDGCAIPASQVTILSDENATRAAVIRELTASASSCGKDDILIFYFSGHGERDGAQFYLLPHEASTAALSYTAIGLEDLQSALLHCPARGILLILDCCKSAGFAENTNAFFRTLAGSEFRLLLSASRAGQLSYEFDNSAGTFFTNAIVDVLTGRVVVGKEPGTVYFSDLFEFVQHQVAEDLEASGQSAALQEPVFAGTFTKDPRLFILSRLSLERLEAETPRYSRKFLRRRIRRTLFAIALLSFVASCLYYTYLDHSRYIWHEAGIVDGWEGDYLAIYAGDPKLNWLGFPHRIFTTDIRTTALPPEVRPGVGTPTKTRFNLNIEPVLFQQVYPEWKVAISAWSGDGASDPWKYAPDLNPFDKPDASGLPEATEELATVASASQLDALETLVSGMAPQSSPKALRKIAFFDPDRALSLLAKGDGLFPLDDSRFTISVLEGLPPHCDPEIVRFLMRTAHGADDNSYIHDAWYGALFRTGCVLPVRTYFHDLDRHGPLLDQRLDWIGGLTKSRPADFAPQLVADIDRLISNLTYHRPETPPASNDPLAVSPDYEYSLLLWADLKTAILLSPKALPQTVTALLTSPYKHLRVAAATALLTQDEANKKMLSETYSSDPWILAVLARAGWFSDTVADRTILSLVAPAEKGKPQEATDATDAVMQMMRAIRLRHLSGARPFVEKISVAFHKAELRIEAIRTVRALLAVSGPRDLSFDSAGTSPVSLAQGDDLRLERLLPGAFMDDSRSWFIRHDSRAYAKFMLTLGDDASEAAQALGRVPLPDSVLIELRKCLNFEDKKLKAATVLAMQGSTTDLELLLTSPDFNIRNQSILYAAYNHNLPAVIERGSLKRFGVRAGAYLRQQLLIRASFEQRMKSLPQGGRAVLLSVLSKENSDASPGVKLLAQDAIDDLEGGTGWLLQNIDMDQLR